MISDQQAEEALHWLIDNASVCAEKRAYRVWAEEYRKSVKALAMSMHVDKPLGAQEREAYKDETYKQHLDKLRRAVLEDEEMRATRAGREMLIDAWRTQKATERSHKI